MSSEFRLEKWQEIEARLASFGWQIRHTEKEDSFHHIHYLQATNEELGRTCKVSAKTRSLAYQSLDELIRS